MNLGCNNTLVKVMVARGGCCSLTVYNRLPNKVFYSITWKLTFLLFCKHNLLADIEDNLLDPLLLQLMALLLSLFF